MAALIRWLLGPLISLVRGVVSDWRRDRALRALGRARAEIENREAADAKAAKAAAARADMRAGDPTELRKDDGYRRD